jgi:hypothetical protein
MICFLVKLLASMSSASEFQEVDDYGRLSRLIDSAVS